MRILWCFIYNGKYIVDRRNNYFSISKKVAAEEMRLEKDPESMSQKELEKLIADLTKQMKKAAAELNFEAAAELRDKLVELKKMLNDME